MNERIKQIRKELHLSQKEFGARLGISRDVVSNIELGRVVPKELLISHMCKLYHINRDWLMTGSGEMFIPTPKTNAKLRKALQIFRVLRPEFQDYALTQIQGLLELQKNTIQNTEVNKKDS